MKLLLVILLLNISVKALANEHVLLAAEDSWPPFSRADGQGISQQIITQAYAASNVKVDFVIVPYARALQMAKAGEVDGAFNVTKQQSTLDQFYFGEEPLFQAKASFYYPPTTGLNLRSINEARNELVVGLILGYEYGEEYEQNRSRLKEIRVSNQIQIINLLLKNRIDVAIMFDEVADYYLNQMQLSRNAIRKGQLNHISDIYVAFSRAKPEVNIYIKKLDQGLRAIRLH